MRERFDYLCMVLWAAKYRAGLKFTAFKSKARKFRLNEWIGARLWAIRHERRYRERFIFTVLGIVVYVLLILCIIETRAY